MSKDDPAADAPLVVATLVHGTWARGFSWRARNSHLDAPWCRTDSPFLNRLRKAFQKEGITLATGAMNWSGANSVLERFAAGERLAWMSRRWQPSDRIALHIVIAHSHGGNIAMEALELLRSYKQPPPAVVTIATPFLHTDIKPRLGSTPLPGCGTFLVLWLALYWLIEAGRGAVPLLASPWLAVGSGALGLAAAWWMMLFFFNPPKRGEHLQVWKACSCVPDPATDMLVLRGTEDEAGMALTLGSLAVRLTDLLVVGYLLIKMIVYYGGALLLVFGLAALALTAGIDLLFGTSGAGAILTFAYGLRRFALGAIWFLGLFTVARLVLPALAKASFGWEFLKRSALFTVTAHSVPDGAANVTVKTMSRAMHHPFTMLHALYDHDDVVPTIVGWTTELLRRRGIKIVKPLPRYPNKLPERFSRGMAHDDVAVARKSAQRLANLMAAPWAVVEVNDDFFVLAADALVDGDTVVARVDPAAE